ncbi:MAG: hypothetical protein HY686_00225 [Chloroflexi bacterium]|nr:hypothetical protein [Chloroflexota bacterium]
MIWFKTCPKCRGDLIELLDSYGKYVACIQCSYEPSEVEERHLRASGTLRRVDVSSRPGEEETARKVA